ncbi:hypothetical protein [Nocardia sp. NBC_00403]|uniref:hypothetical protein n=1 Tax=Nocardia sp. NBC_00403 TaxID=2975990 RepID=UPI002E21B379
MPAPSAATIVVLRLARITALVLGSLLFLYACEFGDSSESTSWWVQIGIATGLGITGLVAGYFQITVAQRVGEHEFLITSGGRSVRASIVTSGNLVFHGHDLGGPDPEYEWTWTFRPTSFPAIRAALGGGNGDLLALLEDTIPELDHHCRQDPGAWLRHHGIPARYREKGVDPAHATRKLPVIKPVLPQPISSSHDRSSAARRDNSATAHRPSSVASHRDNAAAAHRDKGSTSHRDRSSMSRRSKTAPARQDQSPTSHRAQASPSHHNQHAPSDDDQPAPVHPDRPPTRRSLPSPAIREQASSLYEPPPRSHRDRRSSPHRDLPPPPPHSRASRSHRDVPRPSWDDEPSGAHDIDVPHVFPHEPPDRRWNESQARRRGEPSNQQWDEPSDTYGRAPSDAQWTESPPPNQPRAFDRHWNEPQAAGWSESPSRQWDEPSDTYRHPPSDAQWTEPPPNQPRAPDRPAR